jgi:hypothetical protein
MPNMMDAVLSAHGLNTDPPAPKLAPDVEALRLADCYAAFNTKHTFHPGDIVRQKPQAAMNVPYGDNDLAIVIRMLPEPVINQSAAASSPWFREPMDMIVGSLEDSPSRGDHGAFCLYHVDSRRFEPWQP